MDDYRFSRSKNYTPGAFYLHYLRNLLLIELVSILLLIGIAIVTTDSLNWIHLNQFKEHKDILEARQDSEKLSINYKLVD